MGLVAKVLIVWALLSIPFALLVARFVREGQGPPPPPPPHP